MTDKSDRQDVDGLLPCPFCGSSTICIFRKGDGWKVECAGCDSGTAMHNQRGNAIAQWNTRAPTRDSAEGARPRCSVCNLEDGACICAHIKPSVCVASNVKMPEYKYQEIDNRTGSVAYREPAAPPKPAPDAMREALAKAFWVSRGGPPENFHKHLSGEFVWGREYPPFIACMNDADVALSVFSAPVPPADGSSSPAFDRAPHNYGERLPSSDAAANAGEALPSPAVAEPVAWPDLLRVSRTGLL